MNEKGVFLKELGRRIAHARKHEGLTQAQLAEKLGVSQQVVADYENGSRHIQAWRLVCVAEALGIGVEELLGTGKRMPGKRGPTPKIQKQLEAIAGLPKEKRRFVEEVLANILKDSGGAGAGQ